MPPKNCGTEGKTFLAYGSSMNTRRPGSAAVPPSTQAHTLRTSVPDPALRIIMWAKRDLRCRSPQPAHAPVTTVIGAVALWHT